jgi:hypothetical protein
VGAAGRRASVLRRVRAGGREMNERASLFSLVETALALDFVTRGEA